MLRTVVEARTLVAMMVAACVGTWGLRVHPVDQENLFLALIAAKDPTVFHVLTYGYATLWFSTPFFAASVALSTLAIVAYRHAPSVRTRPLPPYPSPERRPSPSVVLGEAHFLTTPGPAHSPDWLTIPQRGLYTGIAILGAVGTGKTSACMYPYVDQLLRWRAQDPKRKVGGLVMEVKGDFCRQVRTILAKAGREDDYLEIGLNTGYCYNPLHNDLDPYAVAYAIASLFNNLFGKSSEPFWQQAYTDLLKFVISLRRISEGYTTLSEVYRYIINEAEIDKNIRALNAQFKQPPDVIAISRQDYEYELRDAPWTLWAPLDETTVAMNPGLARALGVLLKLDFQRAVLQRIPKIAAQPNAVWRDVLFVADEYHAFATVGETEPTGDERAFAMSRQARLIPIVATQSVSSLRSALPGDESWRTLLQCFRTKVFLATSDEFTAQFAADLCGRSDRLKTRYTIAESGQGAHVSLLTGRATASSQTLTASKFYSMEPDYAFRSRVFMELQNAQAVVLPYDGLNQLPPQYCYLKPHYLDVQTSYFDHVARGAL